MKRGRSTGVPTKAQRARFAAIHDVGCIACRLAGLPHTPCEIHHLTIGGRHGQKRRGHDYTIGLCSYHHRNASPPWPSFDCGPSYAAQPRAFRERFGDDDFLLAYQNGLIAPTSGLAA